MRYDSPGHRVDRLCGVAVVRHSRAKVFAIVEDKDAAYVQAQAAPL